jgi:glycosyltransferase involved in cell wall biosynthesis
LVNYLEEEFSGKSYGLITATEKLLLSLRNKPRNVSIIMNSSEDLRTHYGIHSEAEDEAGNFHRKFRLVCTGNVLRDRSLESVAMAIKKKENVELAIAGRPIDQELLKKISNQSNVKYKDLLNHDEILSLYASADAIVAQYDLRKPNYNLSMPIKILEAMMFGLPVITNLSLEFPSDKFNYGIKVDYGNIEQIKQGISNIVNNIKLRRMLGLNARKIFEEKYVWKEMEDRLLEIYGQLLGDQL